MNEQGQVLTTWNEIRSCRKLAILDEYEFHDASVVAVNSLSGLAILQTEVPAPAYALFRTAAPVVGEDISAFSYPVLDGMSLPLTEARGVVRSPTSPEGIGGILQSSALVDGQSPGGPIVDEHGNVIGMIISKLSSGWASNIAYGIGSAPILQFGSTARVRMRTRGGASSAVDASERSMARAAEYTVPVICFR